MRLARHPAPASWRGSSSRWAACPSTGSPTSPTPRAAQRVSTAAGRAQRRSARPRLHPRPRSRSRRRAVWRLTPSGRRSCSARTSLTSWTKAPSTRHRGRAAPQRGGSRARSCRARCLGRRGRADRRPLVGRRRRSRRPLAGRSAWERRCRAGARGRVHRGGRWCARRGRPRVLRRAWGRARCSRWREQGRRHQPAAHQGWAPLPVRRPPPLGSGCAGRAAAAAPAPVEELAALVASARRARRRARAASRRPALALTPAAPEPATARAASFACRGIVPPAAVCRPGQGLAWVLGGGAVGGRGGKWLTVGVRGLHGGASGDRGEGHVGAAEHPGSTADQRQAARQRQEPTGVRRTVRAPARPEGPTGTAFGVPPRSSRPATSPTDTTAASTC